ncbi:DddA-like double-stranded DNA deaminase toxin [Actinopolymorpha alba]|uniref:DddA-like double-stranded DNA deaminase toxin n=1 Tax=Actinopolymorpha alba TaxID=533267 RepID=UPI0003617FCB|nr:DddA-like double-stranded DNA deaminase toxin [Actinopolymorpha alba]
MSGELGRYGEDRPDTGSDRRPDDFKCRFEEEVVATRHIRDRNAADPDRPFFDPLRYADIAKVTRPDRPTKEPEKPKPPEASERRDADRPAPYSAEIAERLPEALEGKGTKAHGLLADGKGALIWDQPKPSGYEGPASEVGWRNLRLPRSELMVISHVEAHAAAQMRQENRQECTLYINRAVCPFDRDTPENAEKYKPSRHVLLPHMLPPGAKLTIYGPGGFQQVYRGLENEK